jgi:hypothetical protein
MSHPRSTNCRNIEDRKDRDLKKLDEEGQQ